jgi:rhodanese-related sulfurtransferase
MKVRSSVLILPIIVLVLVLLSCSRREALESRKPYRQITPAEVKERLEKGDNFVILDVRTKEEYASETGHLQGAILIPIQELENRYHELDSLKSKEIVAYCRTGRRSARASEFLGSKGFKMYNLVGGIVEWNKMKQDTSRGKGTKR